MSSMYKKTNAKCLPGVAFWEHDFFRSGVESSQEFGDEAAFGRPGFTRRDEVANDGVDPGDFINAKNHAWAFVHLKLVHRSAREQIAIDSDSFYHLFAELFFDDAW